MTTILDESGNVRATVGQEVAAGGGPITAEIAQEFADQTLPEPCLTEEFWIVSTLNATDGPS